MGELVAVGIDPGAATGIFFLNAESRRSKAFQCDAVTAPGLLDMLLNGSDTAGRPCGLEEFRRGSKKLKGAYADVTRDLVTVLGDIARQYGMQVQVRPAAAVKPWATDARLEAAGLLSLTGHGMPHARDAARHALYAMVQSGLLPDPLSRQPLRTVVHGE